MTEGLDVQLYTIDSDQEWLEKFDKYKHGKFHHQYLVNTNWTVLSWEMEEYVLYSIVFSAVVFTICLYMYLADT